MAALEIGKQSHDLPLDRHIERAHRLIAHQQPRLENHGAGDTDPLALTAAEFVRIAADHVGCQTDLPQRFCNRLRSAPGIEPRTVHPQRLLHDRADRHARIEARERILEDDLQVTAQGLQLARRQALQCLLHPYDAPGGGSYELQRRPRQGRLAAAGLPDHA